MPRAYPDFISYACNPNFSSEQSYVAPQSHVNSVINLPCSNLYLPAFTHSAPGADLTWQVCPWILSFKKSTLKKTLMYYQPCCVLSNNCHQLLPEIVHLQSCCHQTVESNHQSRACFGPFSLARAHGLQMEHCLYFPIISQCRELLLWCHCSWAAQGEGSKTGNIYLLG